MDIAELMHCVLLSPPDGVRNISEYAKKDVCWDVAKKKPVDLPPSLSMDLISNSEARARSQEDRERSQDLAGIEAITHALRLRDADPHFWRKLRRFSLQNGLIGPKAKEIIEKTMLRRDKQPSEKQAQVLMEVLKKAREHGFTE